MLKEKKGILVLGVIMGFIGGAIFFPGLVSAGELVKTLGQIPPTWSQILSPSERFELVMGGAAVLDKETGLVWEQSQDNTTRKDWIKACAHCYLREVANRLGWRLPTVEELASLVDNENSDPALPTDHPFSNVSKLYGYWTSTDSPFDANFAFAVNIVKGTLGFFPKKKKHLYVWCVRGGH